MKTILIGGTWMLYLSACITFTEDKVPTADVVSYSKAQFCCISIFTNWWIIWNNGLIAFKDTWHLWEYFHNQSARCNLNSISSFLSHKIQIKMLIKNIVNAIYCGIWKGQHIRESLVLMIESEDQSLFLGFIALPPIGFMPLVRWNYNPAKSRSDRSTKRGDSTDLGLLGLRFQFFGSAPKKLCPICAIGQQKI